MQNDAGAIAQRLFELHPSRPVETPVVETLVRFGRGALAYAHAARVRVLLLRAGERYRDASSTLARLGIDVDAWPAPPAGLFVVEERALYLRSRSPMTVAHEFGHALDCALGGGVYRSGIDPRIRVHFAKARAFITPYAATGIDEYFAESLRAYVGVNDPASAWPQATRERLRRIDSRMFEYVQSLFAREFRIGERRAG
ncbi:MAG: hypothetical protein JOY69_01605 [Candidatus Eremiobacteraeota bacterium]|nr:hypothetical protein [Candidatus Eremiobacteraeota bacterium]